jgi:hypothetical protein
LWNDLRAHPFLTELMTYEDGASVIRYIGDLTRATMRAGFGRERAIECSRILVNLTIDHAVVESRLLTDPSLSREARAAARQREATFRQMIHWVLVGVRTESLTD